MLQELVKNKARSIYDQSAKRIMEAVITECSRMGLGHSAAKELLAYVAADDPKVPAVAELHLMAQVVSAVEVAVSVPASAAGDNGGSGFPEAKETTTEVARLTATTLKGMSIEAVREAALELGIEITDQDGGAITRKDLTAEILAKQDEKE